MKIIYWLLSIKFAILIGVAVGCGTALIASAQTHPTIKQSPASDALNAAAKDFTSEQASFNEIRQQAQSTMDTDQKGLQKQIQDKSKELHDKLAEDKKYKPMLDEI